MALAIDSSGNFVAFGATLTKCLKGDHAEYEIVITGPGPTSWTITRRYRQFRAVHKKLTEDHGLKDVEFPPKKVLNNLSTVFLVQRQKSLQTYLCTILERYPLPPKPLADFIEWERYDIHGITSHLAMEMHKHGEKIIGGQFPFEMSVYQIHAINERMKSSAPTNLLDDPKFDFGHLMEFANQLQSLKVVGTIEKFEHSSIVVNNLEFDLSPFQSLLRLELVNIDFRRMKGFAQLKKTVMTLVVHSSLDDLQKLMLGDLYAAGDGQWVFGQDPVPTTGWEKVTAADFSENYLHGIDPSIALVRNLETLNLSENHLTEVNYLDSLSSLTTLLLSRNQLFVMERDLLDRDTADTSSAILHQRLGNIKELRLDHNQLKSALLVDKLYSLQLLDLSNNKISDFVDILCLGRLRCLEKLFLRNNPLCEELHYRRNVFDVFGTRFTEIFLDGIQASEAESDMVTLFRSLKLGKTPAGSANFSDANGDEDVNPKDKKVHEKKSKRTTKYEKKKKMDAHEKEIQKACIDGKRNKKDSTITPYQPHFAWTIAIVTSALDKSRIASEILQSTSVEISVTSIAPLTSVVTTKTGTSPPCPHSSSDEEEELKDELKTASPSLKFSLENQRLHNFVLYSFFSATARHHTVGQLNWALRTSLSAGEVREPEPVCLAVSVQDSTILPLVFKKVRDRTFESSRKDSTPSNTKIFSLVPDAPIYTEREITQVILASDQSYIRVDQVDSDEQYNGRHHQHPRTDIYFLHSFELACPNHPLVTSLIRCDDPVENPELIQLSAEVRTSNLLLFVNVWRAERGLPPLESLGPVYRVFLRFENGFRAVYTVVVTDNELCLVDERINDQPQPPALDSRGNALPFPKADNHWRSGLYKRRPSLQSSLQTSLATSPLSSQSPSSSSAGGSSTTPPPFSRMGYYPCSQLSFHQPRVTPHKTSLLPYPEFDYRLLIKVTASKQRSTLSPRRNTLDGRSSLAPSGITSLDLGFRSAQEYQEFAERLDAIISSSSALVESTTEDSSPKRKSGGTKKKSRHRQKDKSGGDDDAGIELIPFRYYETTKEAIRVRIIPHRLLRELADKPHRQLIQFYQTCVSTGSLESSSCHKPPTSNGEEAPDGAKYDASDDSLLEVLWTNCITSRNLGLHPGLLMAGRHRLHLVTEELSVPGESAPESDRSPYPVLHSLSVSVVEPLCLVVGLAQLWLRIFSSEDPHNVVLVTASSQTIGRILDYVRGIAARNKLFAEAEISPLRPLSEDNVLTSSTSPTPETQLTESPPYRPVSDSRTTDPRNILPPGGDEILAGGRIKIFLTPFPGETMEKLLKIVAKATEDPSLQLHHFSLLEEARLDFEELGSKSRQLHGQIHGIFDKSRWSTLELEDVFPKEDPSCEVVPSGAALLLGVVVTVQCLCVIEHRPNLWLHEESAERASRRSMNSFVVLDFHGILDLKCISLVSHDPRELILTFGGIPTTLDPSQFPNYYSQNAGLEARLDPVQLELVLPSQQDRKLLVRKIQHSYRQSTGREDLKVVID